MTDPTQALPVSAAEWAAQLLAHVAVSTPWSTCTASDGECSCGLIWNGAGSGVVAIAQSAQNSGMGEGYTNEQMNHHARFIAAAPALVAALCADLERARGELAGRPDVVCLCGSTRFMGTFHEANRRLSLEGKIVLSVEIVTYDGATDPQRADPEQKRRLDELHLRKIDLADEVMILNVGGYVGPSTRDELDYARAQGKRISWWEQAAATPAAPDAGRGAT